MECGGHYIYYEKNLEMQNYMIASRKNNGVTPSETIEDRVTKNFRDVIKERWKKRRKTRREIHICGKYFSCSCGVCDRGYDDQ